MKMIITVLVVTNAKLPNITKIDDTTYKAKVDARPTGGKANLRLVDLLSEYFSVPRSGVRVLMGTKSKKKIVEIKSVAKVSPNAI